VEWGTGRVLFLVGFLQRLCVQPHQTAGGAFPRGTGPATMVLTRIFWLVEGGIARRRQGEAEPHRPLEGRELGRSGGRLWPS